MTSESSLRCCQIALCVCVLRPVSWPLLVSLAEFASCPLPLLCGVATDAIPAAGGEGGGVPVPVPVLVGVASGHHISAAVGHSEDGLQFERWHRILMGWPSGASGGGVPETDLECPDDDVLHHSHACGRTSEHRNIRSWQQLKLTVVVVAVCRHLVH